MTLGNMHENRVRSLAASFWICHHPAVLSADSWPTTCLRHIAAELERAARAREPNWSAMAVNHIVQSPLPRRRRVLSLPLRCAGQDITDRESSLRRRTPTPARGDPLGDRMKLGLDAPST
jgi:hypothetical protein